MALSDIRVRLSLAGMRLFDAEIKKAESQGDCRIERGVLVFSDYEGAQATLHLFEAHKMLPEAPVRHYTTWSLVINKMNLGIREAMDKRSKA